MTQPVNLTNGGGVGVVPERGIDPGRTDRRGRPKAPQNHGSIPRRVGVEMGGGLEGERGAGAPPYTKLGDKGKTSTFFSAQASAPPPDTNHMDPCVRPMVQQNPLQID